LKDNQIQLIVLLDGLLFGSLTSLVSHSYFLNRSVTVSSPERFSGVLAPVITPFKADFSIDSHRLTQHCHWLQRQNTGLAVFGTNSEANSLSVDEKIALLDHLVAHQIDAANLMPGTGCCALTDSITLTTHAVRSGCAGVLMLPPFYYKPVSDEGLYASYSQIIEKVGSSRLRLYLYHIPQLSGVSISADLIDRLVRNYPETVVGIKDSSGDWANTQSYLDRAWPDFRVFCGSESLLLQNMQNGGAGCISATANVNPAAIRNLYLNWAEPEADEWQSELNQVRTVFQSLPMIPALKAATAVFAKDPDWTRVRPPLLALNEEQGDLLTKQLTDIGFTMPDIEST